jgi:hypothetical protein
MSDITVICPKCAHKYILLINGPVKRTTPQNKLYWGVYIKTLAEFFGMFPDECHENLKLLFNPIDSKLVPGGRVGASTTKMTTQDFGEYLDKIKIWALTEYNVTLPERETE